MKYFSTKKSGTNSEQTNQARGFTLVELLIAIAVFSVVATLALGSVVSILNAGRKARSLASVMTNLDSTVEVMSREIKFGTHFHCVLPSETLVFPPTPQNCTGSGVAAQPEISFVTSGGVDTVYRLNGTAIQKSTDDGVTWIAVTAPEVVVQSLQYYVFGSAPQSVTPADNAQPRVVIVIRGYAGTKASAQSNFVLQTMVSQRVLDLTSNSGGSSGGSGGGGGGGGPVVPALVQQASSASGSITLGANPMAGDALILTTSGTVTSVSGGGVTWVKAVSDTFYLTQGIWYGLNSTGSGKTITVNGGTRVNVSEWSGIVTSGSPLDGTQTNHDGFGNSNTGSITPPTGDSLVIIGTDGNTGSPLTAGPTGGFSALSTPDNTFDAAYDVVPSASGSYSTTWSHGGANWGAVIAAFKVASS